MSISFFKFVENIKRGASRPGRKRRALSQNYQDQKEAVVMAEIEAISNEILEEL